MTFENYSQSEAPGGPAGAADIIRYRTAMASRTTTDLRVFYLLLIGVGSLLAHLAAEFGAMGTGAETVLFSPRHWYLGCAALAGIITFAVQARALLRSAHSGLDLKRMLRLGLDSLPMRGRGWRYYALTGGLQLAVGSLTQIGEGCPFCGHDVLAGVLGALVTVIVLAFVMRAVGRRLPALVCMTDGAERACERHTGLPPLARELCGLARSIDVWFPLLFNRPPPHLQYSVA